MRLADQVTGRGGSADASLTGANPDREPRIPEAGEMGAASRFTAATTAALESWTSFRSTLGELSASGRFDTRLRSTSSDGRHHTVRDIAIGLGAWPEARTLPDIVDDARAGIVGDFNHDALTDALRARYHDRPDADILAAVDESIAHMTTWSSAPESPNTATLPVRSLLGTLPVLTLLHAASYQLAVYAIDVEASSTRQAPMPVADKAAVYAGVFALVDVTGAIAARQGVGAAIAARTPEGVAVTRASCVDDVYSWRTVSLPPGTKVAAPSVTAAAKTFIEVTTGRIGNIPALMVRRDLVLDDIPGLLHITPVLESVPGLPSGGALRAATASVRAMSGIGGRLGRLAHLSRH